jgi:hypothetical protein
MASSWPRRSACRCASCALGSTVHVETDLLLMALFSHFKYPGGYVSMGLYYEFDVLADVLAGRKLSLFHQGHHNELTRNWSVMGSVSDETIEAILDLFIGPSAAKQAAVGAHGGTRAVNRS